MRKEEAIILYSMFSPIELSNLQELMHCKKFIHSFGKHILSALAVSVYQNVLIVYNLSYNCIIN